MVNCPWLPNLEYYHPESETWIDYENFLYDIFVEDFIDNPPTFNGKVVKIRMYPYVNNKEECFYHIITVSNDNDNERNPDFRRCERITWVREFIKNVGCSNHCSLCDGLKVWFEDFKKNRVRALILHEEQQYVVILEERENYYLLITAYYIEHKHQLSKMLKKYEHYLQKNI